LISHFLFFCVWLQWFNLEGIETGRIKLRANWKHLNNDPASLQQVLLLLRHSANVFKLQQICKHVHLLLGGFVV